MDKMKTSSTPPDRADEADSFRKVALFGVCMATTSCILIMISMPMIYSYVQQKHTFMSEELCFCQSRANTIWVETAKTTFLQEVNMKLGSTGRRHREVRDVEKAVKKFNVLYKDRLRRQNGESEVQRINRDLRRQVNEVVSSYGVGSSLSSVCCGCGISPRGPPGRKGHPGWPGVSGQPGRAGRSGADGTPPPRQNLNIDWCYECANSEPGPPGQPGPPGPPGQRGYQGFDSLLHAEPGPPGPPGPVGPSGGKGPCGASGRPGLPGKLYVVERIGPAGPQGPPGARGYPGRAGTPGKNGDEPRRGPPGDPGQPGRPGTPGFPGQRGYQGETGPRGSCAQCPPPRTAPGY